MKFRRTTIFMMLFALFFANCGEEKDEPITNGEETSTDDTELPTIITVDGIDVIDFYKGCQLTSIHEEIPINNGSLRIKSEINDKIQTYLINDVNNKIYMMSRVPNTQQNKKIVMDIASTTSALVTLHPLFSSMTATEFISLENLVTSNAFYPALEKEVEKVIKEKKNIYDTTNSALISALDNLISDICLNAGLPVDSLTSANASRAVYTHSQINASFIEADIERNVLTLSTKWWTPSYFGTIEQPDGTTENQAILARDDFGALDVLFNRTICGPPMEYKFREAGDYHFSFSRINPLAQLDFFLRATSNILSGIGLSIDYDYLEIEAKYLLETFENLGGSLSDGNMSALEFIGILHSALITQLTEDTESVVKIFGITRTDKMKKFVEMYSNNICVWYNTAKVAGNFIGRLTGALAAPATMDFTHTYSGDVSLEIIKGNEQNGLKNKNLDIPLMAEIMGMDSVYSYEYNYKILFEVVAGGGQIHNEHIFLDKEHVTFNGFKAETEWTLGAEGEQKVKATVVDIITGNKVSSPVYFTADLVNLSLKKVTGDNQFGSPNIYLKEVLGVQIEMDKEYLSPLYKHYEIKYEVVSGNGELTEAIKSPDSDNYTETQWKLGEEGEQKVRAALIDKETDELVCEPVYFTASFYNVFLEKVSGDNQIGMSNSLLAEPLVVRVACTDASVSLVDKYFVYYEVVSGDGQIDHCNVSNGVGAKWTLGSSGEQIAKAILIDKQALKEVGEVYFTAAINDDIIKEKESLITLYNSTHYTHWSGILEDLLHDVVLSNDGYVTWICLNSKLGGDVVIEGFTHLMGMQVPDDHGFNSITIRNCNIIPFPDYNMGQFGIDSWADGLELNFEGVKMKNVRLDFADDYHKFKVKKMTIINSEIKSLSTEEANIDNVVVAESKIGSLWLGPGSVERETGNYKSIKIENSSFEFLYFWNMIADDIAISNCNLLINSDITFADSNVTNLQLKDCENARFTIERESNVEQLIMDNCLDIRVYETCSVYDMVVQNISKIKFNGKFYCDLESNTVNRLSYINCDCGFDESKDYLCFKNCNSCRLPDGERNKLFVEIIDSYNDRGNYIKYLAGYLTNNFRNKFDYPN